MEKLNKLNASIAILNQKLNNIHFNYNGKEFRTIHKLTEKLYKECLKIYDDLSEKISMRNMIVPASFSEYLKLSLLKEEKGRRFTHEEVVKIITFDLTTLIDFTKKIEVHAVVQPLLDEIFLVLDKYR
jgi:starvation-inducible DNA-binding protein